VTENGWFAARPSGTEDIYKIYAETFRDEAHLTAIQAEAQSIVSIAIAEPDSTATIREDAAQATTIKPSIDSQTKRSSKADHAN
jgi:hypothetical protein